MKDIITAAIARSISHNESVKVELEGVDFKKSVEEAYLEVSLQSDDCDSSPETDGLIDVWGTTDEGEDFRLCFVKA